MNSVGPKTLWRAIINNFWSSAQDGLLLCSVMLVATLLVLSMRTLFAAQGDLAAWAFAFPVHVALRALYTALLGPLP